MPASPPARSPLELLGTLASQEVRLSATLRHREIYTTDGLLGMLWHGPPDAADVIVLVGGGMGGYLGPADGLYHELGERLAAGDVGVVRVDYRRPSRLDSCLLDTAAAADMAARSGAQRFVFVGHSFGGAVAVQAGIALGSHTAGVVGLSTQSAGCEHAAALGSTPLLLLHGDHDQILGPENSAMVQRMAGGGELVVLEGADHLLIEARAEVADRLLRWIPDQLARHRSGI